jgi:Rho GTPase-activating protein RGD1
MSIRIADEAGSTDGHGIVGSPTATNGPHAFQSHPAQPPISVSTSNPPNVTIPSRPSLSSKSSSSPPRSSTDVDFVGKSSPSATTRWRSSLAATQRTDVASSTQSDATTVVEPGFDESVLRALCDLDVSVMPFRLYTTLNQPPSPIKCGVPLLLDRIKQSMISCRVSYRRHAALASP